MNRKLFLLFCVCGAVMSSSTGGQAKPCNEAGSVRRVFKQVSGKFEYVVFELIKPAAPEFEVRTEKPPFYEDGPGDRIRVKGKYFKEIDFRGVVWTCDVRESLSARSTAIIDVTKTGQFEGYITYVIGYGRSNQYVTNYVRDEGKYRRYYVKFKK